jgi:glycosyltransferase involved in cell wall biosynthesis
MKTSKNIAILSIVVATKNRSEYLLSLIEVFSHISDSRLELVISDNSDDKNLIVSKSILKNSHLSLIKYCHISSNISMHENYLNALKAATGSYVMCIGDDDFITPEIKVIVDYLESDKPNCIIQKENLRYWWPDVQHKHYKSKYSSRLRIPTRSTCAGNELKFSIERSADALEECLLKGGTEISMLPKFYHGIVSRVLVKKIEKEFGTLFPGATPDMSSAIAIVLSCDTFVSTNACFFVSGTGDNSGGGSGVRREHIWKIKDVPWFSDKFIKAWPDSIIDVACGPTLWASSVVSILKDRKRQDLLNKFNYAYLHAKCAHVDFGLIPIIIAFLIKKNHNHVPIILVLSIIFNYIKFLLKRFFSLVENIMSFYFSTTMHYKYWKDIKSPIQANKVLSIVKINK